MKLSLRIYDRVIGVEIPAEDIFTIGGSPAEVTYARCMYVHTPLHAAVRREMRVNC